MKKISLKFIALAVITSVLLSASAHANAVSVLVGDKDGFGVGCSIPGSCASLTSPSIDSRSVGEAAALNGAQVTDVYSAIFPANGPNATNTVDVIFPFAGTLLSGTVSFGGGDFQADVFGALTANINGNAVAFSFADGRFVTAIHSFTLTASELTAANLAGQVILHIDRTGSGDFIAFDYFELNGVNDVPEPSSLVLITSALAGLGLLRRRV